MVLSDFDGIDITLRHRLYHIPFKNERPILLIMFEFSANTSTTEKKGVLWQMAMAGRRCLAVVLTFILGVQEGNIALFQAGRDIPVQVFPYRADTLPPQVGAALAEGMVFSNLEEAWETAENFGS